MCDTHLYWIDAALELLQIFIFLVAVIKMNIKNKDKMKEEMELFGFDKNKFKDSLSRIKQLNLVISVLFLAHIEILVFAIISLLNLHKII
jgi:hypothetical protein